jgi:hypothetical protein
MLVGGIVDRPTRVLAGIYAIKDAAMHGDVVDVAGTGDEFHRFDYLASLDVVLDQAGRVSLIAKGTGFLQATDLPDETTIVLDAVQPRRQLRQAGLFEHIVDLPCFGIDAHQASDTIRRYPKLAILPGHTVCGTAILRRAEWYLATAELFALHVDLQDGVERDGRVHYLRSAFTAHPEIAVTISHAGTVFGIRHHGM